MTKTAYETAFDTFKAFPEGLADFEFSSLLDGTTEKAHSSALLSLFVKEGLADKVGVKVNPATGNNATVYRHNGRDFSQRIHEARAPTRKRRGPFDDEVKQLRAWKRAAIERFPELGIEPVILEARAKVASILRVDGGDEAKAAMVECGELDNSDMMRVVIAVLRGAKSDA